MFKQTLHFNAYNLKNFKIVSLTLNVDSKNYLKKSLNKKKLLVKNRDNA